MATGCFYGIGVGPGDPELVTIKAARILGACGHVFAPRPERDADSMALTIARQFIRPEARIHPLAFPMTTDEAVLERYWAAAARQVYDVLTRGEDACFITIGDALLYSTYIYLLRALRRLAPDLRVETIPGITSFAAAAARLDFPLGEGKEPLHIVSATDDLGDVRRALHAGGVVAIMKIGRRLPALLRLLDEVGLRHRAALVARVGQAGERVINDLRQLTDDDTRVGNLSVLLARGARNSAP